MFSAPKIQKMEIVSKDQARLLFERQAALETKTFGPFRVVDHFGLARGRQEEDTRQSRGFFSRLWFYIFIFGFRTVIVVFFLYYVLGLEVKIGKKWLPLGPALLLLFLLGVLVVMLEVGLVDEAWKFIERFY